MIIEVDPDPPSDPPTDPPPPPAPTGPTPVVITRLQNMRGTQDQFDDVYPRGYNGQGGFGSIPGYTLENYPYVLAPGELAFCTDTRRTFIGNINGTFIELAANSNIGTGTVTSVAITGDSDLLVSGSPVFTSGIVDVTLSDTGVIPDFYTSVNISVDSRGRITNASSGNTPVSESEVYYIDLYTDLFDMNGDIMGTFNASIPTTLDTVFAATVVEPPIFSGIEFLEDGRYKVTINYIIRSLTETGDWPDILSSHGFDLETLSTGIVGYELNGANNLKSVNIRYNPGGPAGFSALPGNCPSAANVSNSSTFILDATAGAILWPAAYIKSFQTTDTAELNCQIIIERI